MHPGDIATALKKSVTVEAGLLLVILAVACWLRCERLALPPLSSDEAFSWRLTTYSVPELLRHMPGDAHPPLYYLVLKGWIALFGDSPSALRGLSVVFALASIVVLYALCLEAATCLPSPAAFSRTGTFSALFAALLLAVHIAPVDEPSRNARMYSLGVFLAGLSAWLLLRALRSVSSGAGWWLGYGLTVVAFCYTHYYAFFTVAAQTVFVVGELTVRAWRRSPDGARSSLAGFLMEGGLALLLYIPWLPVWWKQTHDVWQGFWIQPVTGKHVRDVFFRWSSGLPSYDAMEFRWWVGFLLVCIVWMVGKGDRGGLFCLLQAGLPWGLSLTFSAWSGRPIFYERYLFFAQLFLFVFWGIVCDRLPGWLPRLGLACLLLALNVFSLTITREKWPTHPPALAEAGAFLHGHYRDGDLVLTGDPKSLNRLRYYAAQAGLRTITVRCLLSPFQPPGHAVNHLGSLEAEDVLWDELSGEGHAGQRLWVLTEASTGMPLSGARWQEVGRWSFGSESGDNCHLILMTVHGLESKEGAGNRGGSQAAPARLATSSAPTVTAGSWTVRASRPCCATRRGIRARLSNATPALRARSRSGAAGGWPFGRARPGSNRTNWVAPGSSTRPGAVPPSAAAWVLGVSMRIISSPSTCASAPRKTPPPTRTPAH